LCSNGKDAAKATLQVMADVAEILPPQRILDSFEKHLVNGKPVAATEKGLWADLNDETVDVLIRGARTLAMIWDAAWKKGGGKATLLKTAPTREDVKARYITADFLPSRVLDEISEFLT
jgi:hypothetical protein